MLINEDLAVVMPDLRNLKDPENIEEATEQLAIISQAMERCEKILQSLALGGDGEEIAKFTSYYKQLMALDNYFGKKKTEIAVGAGTGGKKSTSPNNWWNFWRK